MTVESKLSVLRACVARGDYRGALRIAAKFPRLGAHRDRIQRGWAAASRPEFYRTLGRDPAAIEADGVAALRERYGL